ncbi:HD domain-containing protein [Herbiconiux sp. YIM B11900]|uniref:HD domain-containing protein n=1 Tax=Herbiconiux sp. YIM B11900 TaxID=3404131 RepID=UPI003F84FB8D
MPAPIDDLLRPPTESSALALEVARHWSSPELADHSLRSWAWARTLGDSLGLDYDPELLFVAAMLHDLGVTPAFDSHSLPFETAGGAAAWVFAAGAGWPEARRTRVLEVIERHMWVSVDPAQDAEGYLLEAATSLDVAGADPQLWDPAVLAAVTARVPRRDFSARFAEAIHDQATLKPQCAAARLNRSGRIPAGAEAWTTFAP